MYSLLKKLNLSDLGKFLLCVAFVVISAGGTAYIGWQEKQAIRNDGYHYVFECRDSSFNLLFKFTNDFSYLSPNIESGSLAVKLLNSNEYVWIEQTGCPYIIELGRFKQSSN